MTTDTTHSNHRLYFAFPGDINQRTGGYGYDRRLMAELSQHGFTVHPLQLSASFPSPDTAALADAHAQLTALPEGASIIIDGLALGAMDELVQQHTHRLQIIALCHHPLMYENGLTLAQQQQLQDSEQRALHACAAVIVTSTATRTLLMGNFSLAENKITVALPGTDHQTFATCSGEPPQLLTVASITRRKGHDLLIDALAQLKHLTWQARFVGGDEFDPHWAAFIQQKIHAAGLTERITCTGSITQVESEFLRADIFVLPSHFEGYGMAYAEALSFGLPIIATNAGAIAQVVPTNAGILIPPNDVNALRNTLNHLLSNSEARAQLQNGARTAALTLPRWQDTTQTVAQLILNFNAQTLSLI